MNKVYRRLLSGLKLTYPQYLVMLVLWEQDDLTVSELGARLYLDSSTLTALLKRLQTAGLVSRERSPQDERKVLVRLTTAGRALQAEARPVPGGVLCALGCTQAHLELVKKALEDLRANLLQHG